MVTLNDYLLETRRLLHDANAVYWSDADLTAFINKGMRQRDRDTGQNRLLSPFTLTVAQSNYSLSSVNALAFDVIGITLIWGSWRYSLAQVSFRDLTTLFQPTTSYTQAPSVFAKYGATKVFFAPSPNQAYTTEWDLLVLSTLLVNLSDPDPLPDPWSDPVPFLAAHFAKLELQQFEEANQFFQMYMMRLGQVQAGARGMMISAPYSSGTRHGGGSRWPSN